MVRDKTALRCGDLISPFMKTPGQADLVIVVSSNFQTWRNSGLWVHLHRVLYRASTSRYRTGRCPSVVIMDGQSVKTTERGGCVDSMPTSG